MAYVYILRSGSENIFKIGRTANDVDARIRQLATGSPVSLKKFDLIETDAASWCETYLHKRLCTKRINAGTAQEFFAVTPDELNSFLKEARTYLRESYPVVLEAKRLAAEDSDGSVKTPGNEEQSIYQELLELKEQRAKLEARREYLESQLKVLIGKAQTLDGIADWKTQMRTLLDQEALKREDPETFNRYLKESKSRQFCLK